MIVKLYCDNLHSLSYFACTGDQHRKRHSLDTTNGDGSDAHDVLDVHDVHDDDACMMAMVMAPMTKTMTTPMTTMW